MVADPARRTSKVRQAAKHANIFIVDKSWLAECFSKWQRVSEQPHIIEVEQDSRPTDVLPSDDAFMLDEVITSDENGLTDNAPGDDNVTSLGVLPSDVEADTNRAGTDEHTEDGSEPESDRIYDENEEEILPIVEINAEDWEEMEAELKEAMESDDESDETDDLDDEEEEYDSDVSANTGSSKASGSSKSSRKERKRKRLESGSSSGGEGDGFPESELQRRKKRAFERTTSLTKVENARDVAANGRNSELADVQDDLEREMMRAMAEPQALDRQQ